MDIKHAIRNIFKNTIKNASKTILFVLKIVIPITFVVKLLEHLDLLKYITYLFEPLMQLFGLPGEAALVVLTSNFLNIYGGLAVLSSLTFTVKEVTILSVMILFSHSLFVECAIIKGLKVPVIKQLFIRISAAIISGVFLNYSIGNKYNDIAQYDKKAIKELVPFSVKSFDTFQNWLVDLLTDYLYSILPTIFELAWIIFCVLLGLEILKEFKILDKLNTLLHHLTKHLGLSKSSTSSLIIGLFIGITYGAGAILVNYKDGKMNSKDVKIVTTFLLLSHAMIEDIFLFINKGAVPWIVITYKLSYTIIFVYIYNILINFNIFERINIQLKNLITNINIFKKRQVE